MKLPEVFYRHLHQKSIPLYYIFLKPARYLLLFILTGFASCTFSNEEEVMHKVDMAFQKSFKAAAGGDVRKSYMYMVIPRAGCSGCISSAESYMLKCLDDSLLKNKVCFVLTNFDSEKILKARFGDYLARSEQNIVIDRQDEFTRNASLKSMYPIIYFYDDAGKLDDVSQVSPNQDGLAEAERFLHPKK